VVWCVLSEVLVWCGVVCVEGGVGVLVSMECWSFTLLLICYFIRCNSLPVPHIV
jgi:hypothetical protein